MANTATITAMSKKPPPAAAPIMIIFFDEADEEEEDDAVTVPEVVVVVVAASSTSSITSGLVAKSILKPSGLPLFIAFTIVPAQSCTPSKQTYIRRFKTMTK